MQSIMFLETTGGPEVIGRRAEISGGFLGSESESGACGLLNVLMRNRRKRGFGRCVFICRLCAKRVLLVCILLDLELSDFSGDRRIPLVMGDADVSEFGIFGTGE